MTVSSEQFQVSYVANGTASEHFVVPFVFGETDELFVYVNGSLQLLGTNYSVSGGEGGLGTVTWNGTPTAGATVLILRRTPPLQESNYQENSTDSAEVIEDSLDNAARGIRAALLRDDVDPRHFDAESSKIKNVTPGAAAGEVVTFDQLQAAQLTPGSLPTILPADVGQFLQATDDSPQTAAWETPLPYVAASPIGADAGKVLTVTGAGATAWQPIPAAVGATFPFNFIVNGQFLISQRAGTGGTHDSASTFPNNNDSYVLDRWLLVSNGNDIVDVTHEGTVVPDGAQRCLKATVATANQRFGFFHIIEAARVRRLLKDGTSSKCSIRFKHRTAAANRIRNIRVAVIPWTGTADTVTSDPISAWGAVEGTDPTFVASWNLPENPTGQIAVAQDAWGEHVVSDIALNTSATANVGLLIWCDDIDAAVGDLLYIADVQLESGPVSNNIIPVDPALELLECQRFFWETFVPTTAPAQNVGDGFGEITFIAGKAAAANERSHTIHFPATMRVQPVVTIYNPAAANAQVRDTDVPGDCSATSVPSVTPRGFRVSCTGNAATAIGNRLIFNATADAELATAD